MTVPAQPDHSESGLTPPTLNAPDANWASTLAGIPRFVLQPFSLSAVSVVGAVLLGAFGEPWPAVVALVAAVLLLAVGLVGTPRDAVGSLVSGSNATESAYKPVSHIRIATPVERAGLTHTQGGNLTPFEAICFLHLYEREGGSVGRTRVFQLDYFVDLMTAALVPSHLECLVRELTDHIRRSGDLSGVTAAAGPKRGNALLQASAAHELGLAPLFVKERPLFGKLIEGIGGHPKRAVVIDDISSDGELLVNCVAALRQSGYEVNKAYVLIDRPEGDSRQLLADIGVDLVPFRSLNDRALEKIAARARAGGAL